MAKQKSGDEIERVFKVRQIPKDIENYPSENILQGYLAIDPTGVEVRLRKTAERYFETFKGSGKMLLRPSRSSRSYINCNNAYGCFYSRR